MFIAAMMFVAVYTVFAPVFYGRKHLFIGLAALTILGVLAWMLHTPGLS